MDMSSKSGYDVCVDMSSNVDACLAMMGICMCGYV